jgi:hypothetical protein
MAFSKTQCFLLLSLVASGGAFLTGAPRSVAPTSTRATELSSSPQRNYAWHEYVRNDPYSKNSNGEVNVLRNEYYYPQNKLGNVMQPYGSYRDNVRLTPYAPYRSSWGSGYNNDYNGPYANTGSSAVSS